MRFTAFCLAMAFVPGFALAAQSAQPAAAAGQPRVFLQSQSRGPNQNAARDQSMEMSKDFEEVCPDVRITIIQQMADYTVLLNHIEIGLFVRDNQFQLADKNGDLISKTQEGGSIRGGVKNVCRLILADWAKKGAAEPAQAEASAPDSSAPPAAEQPVAEQPAAAAPAAELAISSVPAGADIEVDGSFVGSTPSSIDEAPGEHVIVIHKKGFKDWQRKMKISGGNINLHADLDPA